MKNRSIVRITAALVLGVGIIGLGMGASAGSRMISAHGSAEGSGAMPHSHHLQHAARAAAHTAHGQVLAHGEYILPRVQVIQWRTGIGRFDTATGAIHRLHGDLSDASVRSQWIADVAPIRGRTSGMLNFQHPIGVNAINAPFAVDMITGETWQLRDRGDRFTWDKVDVYR